jgi:hypothetical protein
MSEHSDSIKEILTWFGLYAFAKPLGYLLISFLAILVTALGAHTKNRLMSFWRNSRIRK